MAENFREQAGLKEDKPKKKKKRRRKHYLLRLLVFVALLCGCYLAARSDLFNVRQIVVVGNNYYTPSQICEMSELLTGLNMFEQKTRPARELLLQDPYIKTAEIKRIPFSTIRITVEEREEYACVPYASEYVLIDSEGMVLRISDTIPVLPLLEGMTINEMTPGSPLDVEQKYLLTDTLDLISIMEENDIYFKKIRFSAVVVKAYIYDELYCEGKPENITVNMQYVKKVVEELYSQNITKGVIKVGKDNNVSFSPKID